MVHLPERGLRQGEPDLADDPDRGGCDEASRFGEVVDVGCRARRRSRDHCFHHVHRRNLDNTSPYGAPRGAGWNPLGGDISGVRVQGYN